MLLFRFLLLLVFRWRYVDLIGRLNGLLEPSYGLSHRRPDLGKFACTKDEKDNDHDYNKFRHSKTKHVLTSFCRNTTFFRHKSIQTLLFTNVQGSATMEVMVLLVFLFLLLPLNGWAQFDDSTCFECHGTYKTARHGQLSCLDCHKDIKDLPHPDKLKKPACRGCHDSVETSLARSAHPPGRVACAKCHTTHFPKKDKKTCVQCHDKVSHKKLPAWERHLGSLDCLACHGDPKETSARVVVQVPGKTFVDRRSTDIDGNNFIDQGEWEALLAVLQRSAPKNVSIQKQFTTKSDPHRVSKKAASCASCHSDRTLFSRIRLEITGIAPFQTYLDPGAVIPYLPDFTAFSRTPHGRHGIACSDCHDGKKKVTDAVCTKCHQPVHNVFKKSKHAAAEIGCSDCHDPHELRAYKELTAGERIRACARCHDSYLQTHQWLPNTVLHFRYLECSTCHSPGSTKSMVFSVLVRENGADRPLTHVDLSHWFSPSVNIRTMVDTNGDGAITSKEIADFFAELKKKAGNTVFLGTSLLVTKVHHEYSVVSPKERVCSTCHSENAPFYESMYLSLPDREQTILIPTKGTILSALPASIFSDFVILGDQKIRHDDVKTILRAGKEARPEIMAALGFKLIDFFGVLIATIVLFFVGLHIIARLLFKR